MIRSPGAAGFNSRSAPVASSRLTDAVAASLAIGSLSLCLIVTLTVLSIKIAVAMPIPALLAASLLIATGTRGEDASGPLAEHPAGQIQSPAGK
jgi:hypothetical protein